MATTEVKVPDLGEDGAFPIISVFVSEGDTVAKEDSLIEIESDKATMEVPSSHSGKIVSISVKEGDEVSEGTVILTIEAEGDAGGDAPAPAKEEEKTSESKSAPAPSTPPKAEKTGDIHAQLVVLGSGPGGYTAAFRAADLGLQTVLIEKDPYLGGVCLNVGCIPSKALLHAAKVITETEEMADHGVKFNKPSIDIDSLRDWKNSVVTKLTGGLKGLAKGRKVEVVTGKGTFSGPNLISVETPDGTKTVSFDQCVIAAGSEPVALPFLPNDDDRVIDSTGALELQDIPKRMLVIGGGIIGLEMACVYDAMGTKVTIVELMDQIIPGADKDLVKPLHKRIEKRYEAIRLKSKVTAVKAMKSGLKVTIEGPDGESDDIYDRVLVSVGRKPNGKMVGADAAGVTVDDRGFISVDNQQRTNVSHIFAIGDVVGQPMLAHKAVHEGKVAAEVAAGHKRAFDARVIPSVAYTDPEVAWVGVTENEAKEKGIKYGKGVFPWAASGRSLSLGRDEGMTKLLFSEENDQVIGAGIVGPNAGDLVAEAAVAIEMGCDATDLGHTIHPHPTLSETVNFAAEMFEGTITDLMPPKKKKQRQETAPDCSGADIAGTGKYMTDEQPSGELTLRTLAMPADVNVNGDIFGGWVLSQMDIAAGIIAGARANGRVATVAIDAMKFIRPVKVGDVLCIYASIDRIGTSSMGVGLEAWVRRSRIGVREKVTEATFTFVAIDSDGNPRPVPTEPVEV